MAARKLMLVAPVGNAPMFRLSSAHARPAARETRRSPMKSQSEPHALKCATLLLLRRKVGRDNMLVPPRAMLCATLAEKKAIRGRLSDASYFTSSKTEPLLPLTTTTTYYFYHCGVTISCASTFKLLRLLPLLLQRGPTWCRCDCCCYYSCSFALRFHNLVTQLGIPPPRC